MLSSRLTLGFAPFFLFSQLLFAGGIIVCGFVLNDVKQIELKMDSVRQKIPYQEISVSAASLLAAHRTGYLPERDLTWEIPSVRGVTFLENKKISNTSRRHIARAISRLDVLLIFLFSRK